MTDQAPKAPAQRLRIALAIIGLVLLAVAIALYAARRQIAREALTGWLKSKGIASEAEVQAFGLTGFTGRLRIGDPRNPDFTAERAEVSYRLRGFKVEVRSVTLRRPVLRASFKGGELSVGALDPLIEEFRRKPPQPDAAKPRIVIDDGELRLTTDYGPVRLFADATVEDEKLLALDARAAPTRLAGKGFAIDLGRSDAHLRTRGDRVQLTFDASLAQASAGQLSADAAQLKINAELPYPDLKKRRGDGAVAVRANLAGRKLKLGDQNLANAQLSAGFRGRSAGWIPDLMVTGNGAADLRASGGGFGEARAAGLRAAATFEDLRWTRAGGDRVQARLSADGRLDDLAITDLRLDGVTATARGPVAFGKDTADLALDISARGHGGWLGLGDPTTEDSADIAAVKRAVRSFGFDAPALRVTGRDSRIALGLPRPVLLTPQRGGQVILAAQGRGYRLDVAGGGLPEVRADVTRFQLTDDGARADGRIHANLSIGPVVDGDFDAAGILRIGQTGTHFTATRCVAVAAPRLELGENDVTDLKTRFCPTGRPLLALTEGGWRLNGRAEQASGAAPFLEARITDGSGLVDIGQRGQALSARFDIRGATVTDAAAERRFYPVQMSGEAALTGDLWRGELLIRDRAAREIARARLRHDGRTESGGVDIDTGLLTFAEGGLQPADLSPMAEMVGSPAAGSARFQGGFSWTPSDPDGASHGVLTIPRMDFLSPAGKVTGLSGQVAFTSLTPLVAAPGQVLKAEGLETLVPLTGVEATFGIEGEVLRLTGGQAAVGGGAVRLESLEVPFTPGAPMRGVLLVEGVQLHDLVEASPFGDRVDLDAKVSGRIPFEVDDGQVRVREGDLRAIQPGRLSIQREALVGVSASGGAAKADTPVAAAPAKIAEPGSDTFTDFAYQAMENLAFDTLDATINSLPEGRVGVLFHVIGQHDPPQKQEIRLTLMDLITRRFLQRELPLPSGTGVNLTLDTTMNLDQLLADYAEYQRLRSSGPVQP